MMNTLILLGVMLTLSFFIKPFISPKYTLEMIITVFILTHYIILPLVKRLIDKENKPALKYIIYHSIVLITIICCYSLLHYFFDFTYHSEIFCLFAITVFYFVDYRR